MSFRDHSYFHIVGRSGNSTAGYYWEPGDSTITRVWTSSTSDGYRGDGSAVDRSRGLVYYGSASHSGDSVTVFKTADGAVQASTTSTTFDNHACAFVHPSGTAIYKYRSTTASNATNIHYARLTDLGSINTGTATINVEHSDIGKILTLPTTGYVIDVEPDIYDRPDKNLLVMVTNTTSNWNSDSTSCNRLWIYQYDMIADEQILLVTFDPDNYTADSIRTRVSELMCKDNGNFIIQCRAGSTDGGLFMEIPRHPAGVNSDIADPTAVWAVNKRTVDGDVRRQLGKLDYISQKYLYLGSGSTNDPEPVGLISMIDGSVLGFRETVADDGTNEFRTHCGQPCLWGKWSEGPNASSTSYNNIRPYTQLIYFSGFGGNHNANPNLAFFNGEPDSEWSNADTTVVKLNSSSTLCGATMDANGMVNAMAGVGSFQNKDDMTTLMHSYGESGAILAGKADTMYDEDNNQMVHMRHGKRWVGGTLLFAGH